ncbi:MAG TPA: hypothetical protein VGI76_02815 [Solirubrobacteraceae bacterium]|jgi:hypothetical protein
MSSVTLPDLDSQPSTPGFPSFLQGLADDGAITSFQAHLLAEQWPQLREDWASNLYLRSIREHARAYIDQQRRVEMVGAEQLGRS